MTVLLKITVCLGLMAGFLLSPKLWLSTRDYPLTPVLSSLPPVPSPFDHVIFAAMLLLLGLIAVTPKAARLIAIFLLVATGYALFDQSRWQPWFYQYLFMLAAIGAGKPDLCRLMVVSIYFWSGIQKINPGFLHETFQWMLEPLVGSRPVGGLALAAPCIETAIAIGLLTRRLRNIAVVLALAMHAFILLSIGPLGHNHNRVVWPWNIVMGTFVILLFWRSPEFGASEVVWGGKSAFQKVVLVMFAILPALSLADLWDSYPSFALYSGNLKQATIYMTDEVADKLPDPIRALVGMYVSDAKVDTLDIEEWSFADLNVPPYAEMRVFKNVGRQVCGVAGDPAQMVLVVEGKWTWFRRRRMRLFTCDVLQR